MTEPPHAPTLHPKIPKPAWERLRPHEEWLFVLTGLALAAGLSIQWLLYYLISPDGARALAAGVGAEILTGREGGIPVGLSQGAPPLLMFQYSLGQDLAGACFGYPLFLYLLHRFHERDNFLMRRIRKIEAAADAHQAFVHRWGPLGLFFFMLMPFLINGPLIGLILGRLTGIHTRYLVLPVVVATTIAAASWTFFFDATLAFASRFDPRLGQWIALSVVGFIVVAALVAYLRERRADQREE